MAYLRYRDEDAASRGAMLLAVGALAGFAAGILLAERVGGVSALSARVRERLRRGTDDGWRPRGATQELDEEYDELEYDLSPEEELEERVLEAFRNDPILSERAVDIGALGEGIIELTGWVHDHDEITHAMTITRGVPDVDTVVNRLTVRQEEDELDEAAERYERERETGAAAGHWEGQQVGTGKRRQGTSAEADRHADPKPELESKWLDTDEALREAAGDVEGLAERRDRGVRGAGPDAGDAPKDDNTKVPRADHVTDPQPGDLPGRNG